MSGSLSSTLFSALDTLDRLPVSSPEPGWILVGLALCVAGWVWLMRTYGTWPA